MKVSSMMFNVGDAVAYHNEAIGPIGASVVRFVEGWVEVKFDSDGSTCIVRPSHLKPYDPDVRIARELAADVLVTANRQPMSLEFRAGRQDTHPITLAALNGLREGRRSVRKLVEDLVDSLAYVNEKHPATTGWAVRNERIATANKWLNSNAR